MGIGGERKVRTLKECNMLKVGQPGKVSPKILNTSWDHSTVKKCNILRKHKIQNRLQTPEKLCRAKYKEG